MPLECILEILQIDYILQYVRWWWLCGMTTLIILYLNVLQYIILREKQPKSTFAKRKKNVRVLKAVTEDWFNNSEQLNRSEKS